MKIGLLKETKTSEGRVGLTPANIATLVNAGHEVWVQKRAGYLSGFEDAAYKKSGARLLSDTKEVIQNSDLIIKVKEPTLKEINYMRANQMIFTYLHLAAIPQTLRLMMKKKITGLAYETLMLADGSLPLLAPMSEIAGRLATEVGAHFLHKNEGGRGVLMGGVGGDHKACVVIFGGGSVGENAAKVAAGMGAQVLLFDTNCKKRVYLQKKYGKTMKILPVTPSNRKKWIALADVLIGAVLVPGAQAPCVVSTADVKSMKKGSVIVDVAVDQGGCVETTEITTHKNPIKVFHDVLHYGVPNMPASVPVTGTLALTAVTFPYILRLANWGLEVAMKKYPELVSALNTQNGKVCHAGLMSAL